MAESLRISIADNGNDKKISGQMREGRMEERAAGLCRDRKCYFWADRQ